MNDGEYVIALGDWMEEYIRIMKKEPNPLYGFDAYYDRYQEFWSILPELIWALTQRM